MMTSSFRPRAAAAVLRELDEENDLKGKFVRFLSAMGYELGTSATALYHEGDHLVSGSAYPTMSSQEMPSSVNKRIVEEYLIVKFGLIAFDMIPGEIVGIVAKNMDTYSTSLALTYAC